MRVVLDTNVLIAAFLTHGVCAELVEHAAEHHVLVVSRPLLQEFHDTLIRKFKVSAPLASEAARLLATEAIAVFPAVLGRRICRDASDDVVLATAMAGDAAAIVTGDKDLLDLKRHGVIRIVSPVDFWKFEAESE